MQKVFIWSTVLGWGLLILAACGQQRPGLTAGAPKRTPSPAPSVQTRVIPDTALRSALLVITDDALWAGHPASRTVTRLSLPSGQRQWQTSTGCEPATLARQQQRLFVACFDSGEVLVLDEESGSVLARRWVGHGPFGVLVSKDHVLLTLAHEDALVILWADSLTEVTRLPTGRQPRGLAIAGDRLYVIHLLGGLTRIFDAQTFEQLGAIQVGHPAALAETITLDPTHQRAFVPHQQLHLPNIARRFDTTVSPKIGILDLAHRAPITREAVALDPVNISSMPIAATLSQDRALLYVVNAASDDLSVVDLGKWLVTGHVNVGHHPRDLALSSNGKLLYISNLVSDDISVVDTDALTVVSTLPLADDPRPIPIQQGERLFFTSQPNEIARDNWIACASCHFDGGFDGQTWLGTEGGPRNTPVLRGIRGTEPLHWSGDRPNVQSFQKTVTGLMDGTGLSPSQLEALAAYLTSLEALPSPLRSRDGSLRAEALRGAAIFRSASCGTCHTPPLFTDRQRHDVGTGEPFHRHPFTEGKLDERMGPAFDTPSLRELWLTAPYLHDGRAQTLRELLTTFNSSDRHGQTNHLSEADLSSLQAFLLSLPLNRQELEGLFGK